MERIEGSAVTPTDLIATIKALLKKATRGPWKHVPDERPGLVIAPDQPDRVLQHVTSWGREADAALIAAAPTLLAACVEALEGMERDITQAEWVAEVVGAEADRRLARADAAEAEVQRLQDQGRVALEQRQRAVDAEAEVARLKDQIARMRPGTSGLLDELERENRRLTAALSQTRDGGEGEP